MRRGEVRWYEFAPPDKKRPVVVLTRNSVIDYLTEVTVAQVTSRIRDIPSEVLLGTVDGVPRECAVNCDHLMTVYKDRLGPMITTLSSCKMSEISEAIHFALDLSPAMGT